MCAGRAAEAVELAVHPEGAAGPGGGEERSHRRRELPTETECQMGSIGVSWESGMIHSGSCYDSGSRKKFRIRLQLF